MAEENKNSKPEAKGEDTPPGKKHARRRRSTPRPGGNISKITDGNHYASVAREEVKEYIETQFSNCPAQKNTRLNWLGAFGIIRNEKMELIELGYSISRAREGNESEEVANLVKDFYDKYIANYRNNHSGNNWQRTSPLDDEGWNLT